MKTLVSYLYNSPLRTALRRTPGLSRLSFACWRRMQVKTFEKVMAEMAPPIYEQRDLGHMTIAIKPPSPEAIKMREAYIIDSGEQFSEEMARYCYTSKFLSAKTCPASTGYQDVYGTILKHLRGRPIVVLEIGIGINDPTAVSGMSANHTAGSSLMGWAEFFSCSEVHGADVDVRCLFEGKRFSTHLVDQLRIDSLRALAESPSITKPIDLIVDDGLHTPEANANSLVALLPYLSRGGVYVCEDISDEFSDLWNDLPRNLRREYGMCYYPGAILRQQREKPVGMAVFYRREQKEF